MLGTFRFNHDDEAHHTPATDFLPGEIRQIGDGRAAMNNSNQSILANQPGKVQTNGIVEVTKGSALVFADGDNVFVDADAIATVIGGGYQLGKARRGGAGNGETVLYVALNAQI